MLVSKSKFKVKKQQDSLHPPVIECTVEVHHSQNQGNNVKKETIELDKCFEIFDAVKISNFSTSVKDKVLDAGGIEPEVKILKMRRNLQIESFENCFGPYIKPP